MTNNHLSDIGAEAVKLTPPAFVTASSIAGAISWSDAAYALTAVYTLLMITQHVWEKWVKPWKHKRGK
jgi:hypothetical protein